MRKIGSWYIWFQSKNIKELLLLLDPALDEVRPRRYIRNALLSTMSSCATREENHFVIHVISIRKRKRLILKLDPVLETVRPRKCIRKALLSTMRSCAIYRENRFVICVISIKKRKRMLLLPGLPFMRHGPDNTREIHCHRQWARVQHVRQIGSLYKKFDPHLTQTSIQRTNEAKQKRIIRCEMLIFQQAKLRKIK